MDRPGSISKAPGARCDLCPLRDRPTVHPKPRRAKLAIVGERPDRYELEHGKYFAGPTGDLLDQRIYPYAGISQKDISYHNAVICTVDGDLSPPDWKRAVACCAPRLALDLKASAPKSVVGAGKVALQALTGRAKITSWIGAPLQGWRFDFREKVGKKKTTVSLVEVKAGVPARADFTRYKILPTMNPAWLFKGNNIDYLPMMRIHFARAMDLANGDFKEWRWKDIIIEPDRRALHRLKLLHQAGRGGKRISFDIETIGDNPFEAPISCFGVGHRDIGAVTLTWESYDAGKYGPQIGVCDAKPGTIEEECREALLAIIADPKVGKVAQNGQYDLMGLRKRGYAFNGSWKPRPKGIAPNARYYDTMKAHSVYAPALKHNLSLVCAMEFNAPRWKEEFQGAEKGKVKFKVADPLKLRPYNSKDNLMQSALEERCEARLADTHRGQEIFKEYSEISLIADEMTWRGVKCDRARRKFHHHALRTRMGQSENILQQIAEKAGMKTFNANSNRDWKRLFFERFKVKPTSYSEKTGAPKLNEEALTPLVTHPNGLVQAAAKAGLQYRKWGILDRNHVRGLRLDARNVVHPFWKPTGTIGWRWSGSRPNPHNVPKPVEERLPSGRRIIIHGGLRDMWIPQTDGGWIVEADYKAIEYRIAAFLCDDKSTLEAFAAFDAGTGPDLHTLNAISLFNIKDREPTKKERTLAKNFIYGGILYEGAPETIHSVLSVDTPIEMSLIEGMIERFFAKHPRLVKWHKELVNQANEKGYVEEPISGRRRHFWSSRIKPPEVYNFPVQTLAGWIMNQGIKKVAAELKWGLEGISFQVHDALVLDGPDPLRLAEILHDKMTYTLKWGGRTMKFPIDVAVGGMTRDKTTGKLSRLGHSSWAPSAEMSLDEIAKLPKGKERLAP